MRSTIPPSLRAASAAALLLPLGGCGAADRDTAPFTVRDSAGIEIVESAAPVWAPEDAWRLAAEPALEIGAVEGDPNYLLERPSAIVLLPDGAVVVADRQSSQLRWFDAAGRHVRTVGGRGAGPGEFQFLTGLFPLNADTLAAVDATLRRTTLITADGQVVGTEALAPVGRLDDGRWIHATAIPPPGEQRLGLARHGLAMLGSMSGSGAADTLAILPGSDILFLEQDMGSGMQVVGMPMPYSGHTVLRSWGSDIVVADGSRYQLSRFDGSGGLRQIARRTLRRTPVTEEVRTSYRENELARVPEERRPAIEHRHEQLSFPDSFPSWQDLRIDRQGRAWAHHYPVPGDTVQRWSVFDPEGRWLGEVQMPADLLVRDIGYGRVAAVWRDDLDVSYIRVYHLTPRQQP